MDFSKVVKERRSVRKFKEDTIPYTIIEEIIEEASYSPSWKNTQVPRYTYIENKEMISKIAEEMTLGFKGNENNIKGCSGLMLVTYIAGRAGFERDGTFSTPKGDGFEMFDAGIATQTLCLSAYNKGIATVILGYFDETPILDYLNLAENQKVAALVCMGYASEAPAAPKRKEVSQLLTHIK